jgi:TetR/AcrR family transcriptional regulator, transcriptional repressor for nem operon
MAVAARHPRPRGRPPKVLAGYSETRESLLRAGMAALTEKGFSATGIDEVLRSVGVPKGSFYHYFASKDEFGSALISRYAAYFAGKLERHFQNQGRLPLERIQDFIDDAARSMERFEFRRGCLVGNLGQEMGALSEPFRQQLNRVFVDWQQRTSRCLRAAQQAKTISRNFDCDWLAEFFWVGWEGAVLRAKLEQRADPLHSFGKGFFQLMKQ